MVGVIFNRKDCKFNVYGASIVYSLKTMSLNNELGYKKRPTDLSIVNRFGVFLWHIGMKTLLV